MHGRMIPGWHLMVCIVAWRNPCLLEKIPDVTPVWAAGRDYGMRNGADKTRH